MGEKGTERELQCVTIIRTMAWPWVLTFTASCSLSLLIAILKPDFEMLKSGSLLFVSGWASAVLTPENQQTMANFGHAATGKFSETPRNDWRMADV